MTIDGIEVKPCPYCGNTGPVLRHLSKDEQVTVSKYYGDGYGFLIVCGRYHCDNKFAFVGKTKESCIKNWNEEAEKVLQKYEGGEV